MIVAERALKVKFNLWERFGVKRGLITEKILREAIYATGLSRKSRGMKAVISYLRDYRHLGKYGAYYYVIYVKKEEANPKYITPKVELKNSSKADVTESIYWNVVEDKDCDSELMRRFLQDIPYIKQALIEKKHCLVEFRLI